MSDSYPRRDRINAKETEAAHKDVENKDVQKYLKAAETAVNIAITRVAARGEGGELQTQLLEPGGKGDCGIPLNTTVLQPVWKDCWNTTHTHTHQTTIT